VLIDNFRTTDGEGKVTETALTEEQLGRINTLVRDAVGFDEKRGDRVSVVNQSFLPEKAVEEGEAVSIPLWERPMVLTFAKLGAGLVALLLLLIMVVKPLLRSLSSVARAVVENPTAVLPAGGAMAGEGGAATASGAGRPSASMAYEQQIAQARSLVAKDPARVAQVVKDWVQKDE
jgi:flagellar M-ring protein FliF